MGVSTVKRIFILTIAVFSLFALIYAALLAAYFQERRVQQDVSAQVEVLSTAVAQEASEQRLDTLRTALATAQAEQAELQHIFPKALDATEIVAHIVHAAADNRIRMLSLTAGTPISLTSETGIYEVLNYTLTVEGTLPDLKAFFLRLEDGSIGTLTIEELEAYVAPTPTPVATAATVSTSPTPTPRRGAPTPTPMPTATPTPTPEPGLTRYRITLTLHIYTRQATTPTPQP